MGGRSAGLPFVLNMHGIPWMRRAAPFRRAVVTAFPAARVRSSEGFAVGILASIRIHRETTFFFVPQDGARCVWA
jgi:hypothetical protein